MASSTEIFNSVVAGKVSELASTSKRKQQKLSGITDSSTLFKTVARNRFLDNVPTRIEQGDSALLSEGTNRVTFSDINGKGTDADSGYFYNDEGKQGGLRGLGIDTPEHSFYNAESTTRAPQKKHYARLWGVSEDTITDDVIFSMGKRADDTFNKLATEGQGTLGTDGLLTQRPGEQFKEFGDQLWFPEADASYNPTSEKWSTDKRTKATLTNPATGVDLYGAMNTPEFNTRWFQDSPEQNAIRERYEAENGNDYSRFKMPNEGVVVGNTQHGKPAFYMKGEVVSEKSTTLQIDGKWVNVPTIVDGKQYSEAEIAQMLTDNTISPTSVHNSEKEASIAAKARSMNIDYGQNKKSDFLEQDKARRNALYADAIGADSYWTVFEKSVSTGVDNLQATGYGFAALIADATGNTELATEMLEHYLSNIDEAQQNGANIPPIEEVDWANPDAALRKLISFFGEAMPSIVEIGGVALAAYFTGGAAAVGYASLRKGSSYLGTRYVKKQLGKKQLQKIQRRSASVGGYLAANVMETGSIYGEVGSKGHRDARAITMSLAGGSAAAALEMFYPLKLLNKMGLGKQGTKQLYKTFRKNGAAQIFKQVGKEMSVGGLTEGTTEALQFVIEEATQDLIKFNHLPDMASSEFLWGMANSFVAGLVPGSVLSGGGSAISETRKQIDGDRKFTDEQTAQVLQDALEAGEGTSNMTEQEIIANEQKLDAALSQLEENESLNFSDIDTTGMGNVDRAFAYLASLEPAENEDGTVETVDSTPEVESAKNELISAIQNFTTDEASTQLKKEYALGGAQLKADIRSIEQDITKRKEALTPGGKPKTEKAIATLEVERVKRIAKKQQEANNRFKATGGPVITQRKAARAETKVIRTTIEKSIKKINAITNKLKDVNISKKQRKRLEQERNNLGKHITDLQGSVKLSTTMQGKATRAINSFDYKYKSANIDKDEVLRDEVKVVDTIQKSAVTLDDALDNDKATIKEKVSAMNAFLVEYKKIINARDKIITAIGVATDKAEVKALKKGLADIESKILSVDTIYDKAVNYKLPAPSKKAEQKDVLYSLTPLSKDTIKELKSLTSQLSSAEKELLAAHIELAKTQETVDKAKNESKNMQQVRGDVLMGTDKEFIGFMEYLRLAEKGKDVLSDVNYFIGSLQDKLAAFKKAYRIVSAKGKVWINKDTLEIFTTEPTKIKNEEGKLVENLEDYWWVTKNTNKLIRYIHAEIKFGQAIYNLISKSEQLAPGRAKQVSQDAALQEGLELIAKQKIKTAPDTGDLDSIEIEETKPVVKKTKPVVKKEPEEKAPTKEGEKKTTKLEDYINKLDVQMQQIKDELAKADDSNDSTYKKAPLYVKQLRIKLASLQAKALIAKRQSKVVINNLLNKFQDSFLKIKDSAFTSFDIFITAHAKRDSFYTRNPLKSLLDKDGGSTVVTKMLTDIGVTDPKFINYLGDYFLEYRKAFTDTLLEPKNSKKNRNRDSEDGAFTQRTLLNYLYVDIDGVRTLPDEVIFAMMMTSLNWMSINQFNSEVTDKQSIASLLYGDRKHPVTKAEFRQFGNMGILWNSATTEMGVDIFNNLNIKVDSESLNGLKIQELTYDILESIEESGTVIKDPSIGKELQIALGQMALVVASTVHPKNSKLGHDGIVKIHHTKYSHPEFMHDVKLKKLVGNTDLTKKQTIAIEKDQQRRIKTIKFPLLDGTYKDVHDLEDVIESFKSNKKNITLINGTESRLAEPLLSPSKKIQKYVRNSFIALPDKVQKLLGKLQNVEWAGKVEALGLFSLVDDTNMDILLDIQDIETKHDESVDGYTTSNEAKRKDVKQVKDYIKQGLPSFWFKYSAQKQHRIRIDSNGINGVRSKIHRALFLPKSADVLIKSELDRALYQVSIAQALGYGIDKNGLKGSLVEFDRVLEVTNDIVEILKAGDVKGPAFNKALAKLLKDGDISPSMHVLEALASLAKYHPTKPFKTAKLGIETDGITNGYAIALLQFYGVPDELLSTGTDEEIAEHLAQAFARVGVMVKPGETMEKFIERGELDVYESLASFIQKTLASKGALTDINAERSKKEGEITKDNLDALTVIHGDLWDSVKDSISKFGRNLAKNPLMISGYGAQINKIIQNLAADIIPKIYDDIAELQTKYNTAETAADKAAVVKEATKYEEALSSFIQVGRDKNIPIVAMLKKDELKSFILDKEQSYTIQKDFKDIFTPAITTALNQFIAPLAKARDAIIKSGDIQYRAFKHEYTKALKVQADKRGIDVEKLTLTEQKAIAESLATTYMPLVYGPWSDDGTLIQIIKDIRSEGNAQRNTVNFKGQQIQRAVKQGRKFKVVETVERFSIDSSNFQREYVTPGVSAYTNTIQNIDSVILGEALLKNPEVLSIFDAMISNVTDALDNKNEYNEAFRDVALNFSVLEKALERTLAVKGNLSKEAIAAVNKDYRENSHEATQLLNRLETTKDSADRAIIEKQIAALGFDTIEMEFHEEVARVTRMKNIMSQVFGDEWLENATISQMYLAETIQDIANGDATIESIKAGSKVTKQKTTTNTPLQGTSVPSDIVKGFKNAKDAATKLSNSKNQTNYIRHIAKMLIPLLSEDTKVSSDFDKYPNLASKEKYRSYYSKSLNMVLLNPTDTSDILLHELIHAATQRIFDGKLTGKRKAAVEKMFETRQIIADVYYADVKAGNVDADTKNSMQYFMDGRDPVAAEDMDMVDNFLGLPATAQLSEFLTMVLTDQRVQTYLKSKKYKGNKTLWNKFVEAVRDLLGLKDNTLLDEALSASLEAIDVLSSEVNTPEKVTKPINKQETIPEFTPEDSYKLFKDDKGNDVLTNSDQTTAINKMKEWWKSDDKIFVLAGRGGTGKTTIVNRAIKELGIDRNLVKFALPTHKAKKVIALAATDYSEEQFTTLASLLGQTKRYNKNTRQFTFERDNDQFDTSMDNLKKSGIKLLVIDEASMVSEKFSAEIKNLSDSMNIRVIFMGDNVQLPPIEASKGKLSIAAVFDNVMGFNQKVDLGINKVNYVKLNERMRQGEDSPILGITDILANTIEYIFNNSKNYDGTSKQTGFVLPSVPETGKHEGVHYAEGTVGAGPTEATLDAFVAEYEKDPANVKYIHFNKESKERTISIRSRVRAKLFPDVENSGDLKALPFIKSERIVLGDSTVVADGNNAARSTDLHNGDEVTVIQELNQGKINFETGGKYKQTFLNIPVQILQVKDDTGAIYNLVLEDKLRTKKAIRSQMTERQKQYNMEIKIGTEMVTSETSAAYLINTHKAQGSTYKTVYVDYENIMGKQGSPDWLTKLASMYVATSRPSERLVLVGSGDLEFGTSGKDLQVNLDIATQLEQGEVVNKDSDTLGSLDSEVDAEAKEVYRTNSIKTTAQNIFNKLNNIWEGYYPNSQEKEAQASHLQRVLDEIILPTGEKLDNTTVILYKSKLKAEGEVKLETETVKVNINKFAPDSYAEQTAQEVYLHEMIHILTNSALAKNERFKADVTKIRNAVKVELEKMERPYEMFLHKDADGNVIVLTDEELEIEAAKKQYNYLFGDNIPDNAMLDEFLAYSLTNKHLVKQLTSMKSTVVPLWSRDSETNVIEKLVDLLTEIVTRIANVLNKKSRPQNLEMEIFNLTKDMVTVSQEKSGTIRQAIKKQQLTKRFDQANEVASDFLKDAAKKGLTTVSDAYIKGVDKLTRDGKIDNFLANVLYDTKLVALFKSTSGDFIRKHPELQSKLDYAFKYFRPELQHNIAALKADAFGGIDRDFVKLMYKSQKEVDKARVAYKELTRKSLLKAFLDLDSLTPNEKEAITRVLLKADFSTLEASGAYSMEKALSLLTDGKALSQEISKYADLLGIGNNTHYDVQATQLANFMMSGKVKNHNQYKNAHMIIKSAPSKSTYVGNKKAETADLDVYITLLALRKADNSIKQLVANVVDREFKLDGKHNGITHIIHHHIAFKKEAQKAGFNNNPALMTKGYISTITDPDIQIEFAANDKKTKADMVSKGYEYVSDFEVITGLHAGNFGIYTIKNLPDVMRAKGITSVTAKHHAGTSFKEIISRNPEVEGQVNLVFRRWRMQQTQKQNTLDSNYTMLPIINDEGKIVDYSIHMHHVLVERLLKQELAFDEVMPTMYSHQQDKIASENINKEAMDLLYQHTKLNYPSAPHKFVDILDGKYKEEYFDVLPKQTRNYILHIAKRDSKKKAQVFYVEHKLLDMVFGYKMPSISNTILFKHNFKLQRYAKVVEKLMFEMVAYAKVNIVIKIPIVPIINITSNFVTSALYGIPPTYLIKKWREGHKELERYQKDAKRLQLLELDSLGNPALRKDVQIQKKMKRIKKAMNENKVAKFIDAGLFNSITEDINRNDFTYRHKAAHKIKSSVVGKTFNNLFKGKVVDVANQAYMGEQTAVFKTMMHFTQMSDFIARYAMYSHDTEVKGMDKDKAYTQMVETFVNYDQPLNKYLQYGNDIGLLFFVKYWIRIQRATFNLVKEKPLNVGLLWIANGMLDLDIESIMESSVLTGNFFPTVGGPGMIIGEAFIPPGVEILSGEGF